MTNTANYTMMPNCKLHEEAMAADRAVYTIQSLLSVCKHVAVSSDYDADRSDIKSISADMAACLEHAGKLLVDVGDFIERVSGFAEETATDQRTENA